MNPVRANSSPDLPMTEQYDDSALEGVAANVKLLLKLIQDHKDACGKGQKDSRRMLRVAGMMTILDNVRTRIQKCQSFGNKKRSEAELRRCTSDVKMNRLVPRDRKSGELVVDERETLRKQLNASLAARKSLEIMCSSLGKEKEIMVKELARKNSELSELEEHINDLRTQNNSLLEKLKEFAADNEKAGDGANESQENVSLQEHNKVLSQQLLRSLDGYRYMKRKLRDAQEEALQLRETMEEMSAKAGAGLQRVRGLKKQNDSETDTVEELTDGTEELENLFECLQVMVSKHGQKKE